MKRLLSLLLLGLLPGCILAIGVDDDEWGDDDHAQLSFGWHGDTDGSRAGVVSGRVLDQSGAPVAARIVAVYPSGSYAQECAADGSFSLGPLPTGHLSVKATTADGASVGTVHDLELERGEGLANIEIRLEPGATLQLSYEGQAESYRCALFRRGERVDDFTLRKGVQETVIVPAGRIPMQLYQGDRVFAVSEVDVAPGSVTPIVFRVE